jgi:hypothetical protein
MAAFEDEDANLKDLREKFEDNNNNSIREEDLLHNDLDENC